MPARDMDEAAELALRTGAKQELRERLRAPRTRAICARLTELSAFAHARVVVGYTAYRKEADPAAALVLAEQAGKRVGLVRIDDAGELAVHAHRAGDVLAANAYGIDEPLPSAPRIDEGEVDLIVVPALAVDERGHRIGYGQGYYDRLLPRLAHAFKVAVAYDFQRLVETPNTPHDARVDCVITDVRTIVT